MAEIYCDRIIHNGVTYAVYWNEPNGEVRVVEVDAETEVETTNSMALNSVATSREEAVRIAPQILAGWGR